MGCNMKLRIDLTINMNEKKIIWNVARVPQFLIHNIKTNYKRQPASSFLKKHKLNINKQTIHHKKYPIQFYMKNPTIGKFHHKNKNPRHTRVHQSDTNQSQSDFHERNMNFDQTKQYMKFTSYARIMKNIFDRTLSIASPIQTNQRYTDN
jgi:hypothetical protein